MSAATFLHRSEDSLSVRDCPHVSVLLCERVVLVPALVAGGGGMEGSGGLTCLKSRKTKVNPALGSLLSLFLFSTYLGLIPPLPGLFCSFSPLALVTLSLA